MSKVKTVASAMGIFLLVLAAWLAAKLIAHIPRSPEAAIKSFYEREVAEDQIMDPLILVGVSVIPLLEKEVTNPNMPNRRYAIGALGNLRSKSSLPILERLTRMKSEEDYIRCDALTAIGMIDYGEGMRVVDSVKTDGLTCLANIAHPQGYAYWLKSSAPRRTYLEAILGWHN